MAIEAPSGKELNSGIERCVKLCIIVFMENTLSTGKAAKLLGVSVKT
jgi:predicted HTH domain antitoxin